MKFIYKHNKIYILYINIIKSIYIKSLNLNIYLFFNPSFLKICKILCILYLKALNTT